MRSGAQAARRSRTHRTKVTNPRCSAATRRAVGFLQRPRGAYDAVHLIVAQGRRAKTICRGIRHEGGLRLVLRITTSLLPRFARGFSFSVSA